MLERDTRFVTYDVTFMDSLQSKTGCVLTKITYIGTWTFPKYRNNT